MMDRLAGFHADTFKPHVQTAFEVSRPDAPPVTLHLVDVREIEAPGQEIFALLFRGPAPEFLGQGIQQLRHEVLEEFPLFLVPIARDGDDGVLYEAAFNRFVHAEET